jgi:hypothetical protein
VSLIFVRRFLEPAAKEAKARKRVRSVRSIIISSVMRGIAAASRGYCARDVASVDQMKLPAVQAD